MFYSVMAFSFFLNISESTMLPTNMPKMTISDTRVVMCQWNISWPIIFTPMKASSRPRPYFSSQNLSVMPAKRKNGTAGP